MNFDFIRFCKDYSIQFIEEGDHHCTPGWIQIDCPFCEGRDSWHLGYNIRSGFFHCWKCGFHSLSETIEKLTKIPFVQIPSTYKQRKHRRQDVRLPSETSKTPNVVALPCGTIKMAYRHKFYLLNRNFNPNKLQKEWDLLGTGHLGNYKFRIIIPIIYNNRIISFTSRDITDKSPMRYKSCSKEKEIVHHKTILYGIDKVRSDSIIIVEGIPDVWRLGSGAVGTFGTTFLLEQIKLMCRYKNRFILFDSEIEAQKQARKLSNILGGFPGHTEIVTTDKKDPAELNRSEVAQLKKELQVD